MTMPPLPGLGRRAVLAGALATAVTGSVGATAHALAAAGGSAPSPAASTAARTIYGSAVRDSALTDDAPYRQALQQYCGEVVGEGGLKWIDVRPTREQFVFDQPDRLLAFAEANGMSMRGHTLDWYGALPGWLDGIADAAEARSVLTGHIATVVGRYRGKIGSWDVVNEPVADDPGAGADLREFVWSKWLGEDHLALALQAAAAADSGAQLVLNEYDIEHADGRNARRREALLKLIRRLRDRNVPLHAIGLQGHLHGDLRIDVKGLGAFLKEVRGMGLDVLVTELDVIDNRLPGPVAQRDAACAAAARAFLEAIFEVTTPTALLSWGITDKYTWVPMWFSRKDKAPNRPLPLDAEYRRKPLMDVIETFATRAP
jgi:endo-1,4-beta-xylanase